MRLIRIAALIAGLICGAAHAEEARISVDQIEIEGVVVLNSAEAQSAIEVSPGDYLERTKIIRSARNLQTLYFIKGYQDMTVKSDVFRRKGENSHLDTVLRFLVTEAKPTRVRSVRIVPDSLRNKAVASMWPRLERELISRIAIKVGDPLDQDRISELRRNLENELAAEEFVGAKASDVRVNIVATPEIGEVDKKLLDNTQRWAELEFHLDLGDRVSFGFRGNQALGRNELMKLVEDQRVVGLGSDYVITIRGKLEEQYRQMGYAHVQIIARPFENPSRQERHVTYEINEGPRVRIESLDFDGNIVFSEDTLRDKFFELAPYLTQRHFYVEKEVDRALHYLIEWVQSQGYLFAKSLAVTRTFVEKDNQAVRLLIYMSEGEQTLVHSFKIQGAHEMPETEIRMLLGQSDEAPLNLFAFSDGLEKIKARYKERGFLEARVENEQDESIVRYTNRSRSADILVQLSEGPRFRFGEIRLFGLDRTLPIIVRRELRFEEGDFIEQRLISESEARLRRLGIFATASIELKDSPGKPGYKDVNVVLAEGSPGKVGGGIGFRNDLGIRVFGETSYANLWHQNHTWSLSANANRRFENYCRNGYCFAEYQVRMGYVWPYFLLNEMTFRPELTQEQRRYIQFDARTTALTATVERRLLKYVNLVGALTYSIEQTRQSNAQFTVDQQTLLIGAFIPSLRLDLRDDPWSPTRGFYGVISDEEASTAFGSQSEPFPIGYRRTQFRADYTIPVAPKISWYLSFRTGIERNTVSPIQPDGSRDPRVAIPLIKQFTLGGVASLRGFKTDELNLQSIAIQQATYVNYRTQIDLPFFGDLRIGPFLDAGNLLVDKYSFGQLRYGTGFGFHYLTPVGPVNFDWGFKIDPLPNEDPYNFYFSIGII